MQDAKPVFYWPVMPPGPQQGFSPVTRLQKKVVPLCTKTLY